MSQACAQFLKGLLRIIRSNALAERGPQAPRYGGGLIAGRGDRLVPSSSGSASSGRQRSPMLFSIAFSASSCLCKVLRRLRSSTRQRLQAVALGNTEPEVLGSVAARLAHLEKGLPVAEPAKIAQSSCGYPLNDLARR